MTKQQEHTLNWHDQDCPELLRRDPRMFSVSELLQIILGYRKEEDDKLYNLMELCDQKIDRLRMLSTADLKHLGFAQKEIDALLAALELGKRQWDIEKEEKNICSSRDAYEIIRPKLLSMGQEEFWVLLLNRANVLISMLRISLGGVSGTVVDAKVVFWKAIQFSASSIIMAHNHPSGNLIPSQADKQLTQKFIKAGATLDIIVLDHLILSDRGYFSFADEGLMED